MRVTLETKAATRRKILEVARTLFAGQGFEATTTRDIAQAAEIATGTVFNYFATKEAILASLANEAVKDVHVEFERPTEGIDSFEQELFAYIAAGLRKLKPLRKHLPSLLHTSLSLLAVSSQDEAVALRVTHLETVVRLAAKHGEGELSPLAIQLYWTLYIGVLEFWSSDKSPKQEETLALVDHSVEMFVGWLNGQADHRENVQSREKKGA